MYSAFLLLLFWFKRLKSHFCCCCCFAVNLEVDGFKYGQYVYINIHIFMNLNSNNKKKFWRLDSCSWGCLQTCLVTETDFRVLILMFLLLKSLLDYGYPSWHPNWKNVSWEKFTDPWCIFIEEGRQNGDTIQYHQRNFRTLAIHTGSMSSGSLKKVGSQSLKTWCELSNLCCPLKTPGSRLVQRIQQCKIECLTHFHGSQFICVYRNIRLQSYGWRNIGHCKVRI